MEGRVNDMPNINNIANEELGILVREKLNAVIDTVNILEDISVSGAVAKENVDAVVTSNVGTLSGEQTLGGIVTSSSRLALVGQTAPSENGVWDTGTPWTRATDMDASSDINLATVLVTGGDGVAQSWRFTVANPTTFVLDSDDITPVLVGDGDALLAYVTDQLQYKAATAQLKAIQNIPETLGKDGALVVDQYNREILGFDLASRLTKLVGIQLQVDEVDLDNAYVELVRYLDNVNNQYPSILAYNKNNGELTLGAVDTATKKKVLKQFGQNIQTDKLTTLFDYGQSRVAGGGVGFDYVSIGEPVTIKHAMKPSMLMFNSGPYPAAMNFATAAADTYFADLVGYDERPRQGRGQTQGSGFCIGYENVELFEGFEISYKLFCSFGKGAQSIAAISQGTIPYQNGLTIHRRAASLASQYGLTYDPVGIGFTHGEEDIDLGTTLAAYQSALEQLAADIDTDWQALHAKDTPYCLLVDQVAAGSGGSTDDICLAQNAAADGTANIYMTGPQYHLELIDLVHGVALAYDLLGERKSHIAYKIANGESWEPCKVLSGSRSGTTITLSIHVPNDSLMLDTISIASAPNSGFTYTGANITNVVVGATASNLCDITITIDADAGGTLEYAMSGAGNAGFSGAWGNVRDSESNMEISLLHPTYFHANWLRRERVVLA